MGLHVWAGIASNGLGEITPHLVVCTRDSLRAVASFAGMMRHIGLPADSLRDVALIYVGPMPDEMDASAYLQRLENELPNRPAQIEEILRQAARRLAPGADDIDDEMRGV